LATRDEQKLLRTITAGLERQGEEGTSSATEKGVTPPESGRFWPSSGGRNIEIRFSIETWRSGNEDSAAVASRRGKDEKELTREDEARGQGEEIILTGDYSGGA